MKTKFTLLGLTTAMALYTNAQIENCLHFDGTDDYVTCGDIVDFDSSNFTIEAWVYIEDSDVTGNKIINKGLTHSGIPDNAGYSLRASYVALDEVEFTIGHSDGSVKRVIYNGLELNRWYHLAGVRRGIELLLYVDGELVASGTTAVVYNVDTNMPLAIGAIDKGGVLPTEEFIHGKIDEVRLWRTARSGVDIYENKDCAITTAQPNLELAYNFDHSYGSYVADSSGNGYTGEIISAPLWSESSVAINCSWFEDFSTISDTDTTLNVMIYPNPAANVITVSFDTSSLIGGTIEIQNNLGETVIMTSILKQQHEVDLYGLPQGLYIVKISKGRFNKVEKILVY